MKKRLILLLCLLVGLSGLMLPPAAAAGQPDDCLYLEGTVKLTPTGVLSGEEFVLEYRLTPDGDLVETINRDPIDIVFLVDVSYSMNESMGGGNKQKRIDALKQASRTLLNSIRNNNANDRIGIVSFAMQARKLQDLTSRYSDAERVLNNLTIGGSDSMGTNMGDGMREASSMLSKSNASRKAVIALSDGANNYYRDARGTLRGMDYDRGPQYAYEQARIVFSKGIPIYTIALGHPSATDVNHDILEQISNESGGKKYDAETVDKLAEAFSNIVEHITKSGQLSSIRIIQQLPSAGFELAEDNDPGVSLSGNVLTIDVPPIQYPYDENAERIIRVKLRYNGVGSFTFEDADLRYVDACGAEEETTIPNGHTLSVNGWKDVWGNLYTGDAYGRVIRYKHGMLSDPQIAVNEANQRVTDVAFQDSPDGDDDSIVVVTYQDGSTSTWDLRPTAPDMAFRDALGAAITDETAWHQGKAKVRFGGSVNQLPASTEYMNDDFKNDGSYVARYQYRINGGPWKTAAAGEDVAIAETGVVTVEARALTNAISGFADKPVAGLAAVRTIRVDDTPPVVHLSIQKNDEELDPAFTLEASDPESGIASLRLTIEDKDGNAVSRTYEPAGGGTSAGKTWRLSEFFGSMEARRGWAKITVQAVNGANLATTAFRVDGETGEKTQHYELVYDGPGGRLESDGDYSVKAAGEPVLVRVKDVTEVLVPGRPDCAECQPVTVQSMEYRIVTTAGGQTTDSGWQKLGAFQFRLTAEGRHDVYLKITDSLGKVHDTKAKNKPLRVNINYQQNRH